MSNHTRIGSVIGLLVAGVGAAPAFASFHFMQIEQVIGGVNGDATAQAIQLRMRSVGQNLLGPSRIRVFDAAGLNPVLIYDFIATPSNFTVASGAGRRVLLVSPNFPMNTGPAAVDDVSGMVNLIPASYLAAGSLTFEDDSGSVYWRLSWGGAGYTGSGSVIQVPFGNDNDGNANPPFGGALPSSSTNALQFMGLAGDQSTNNLAQYALTGPNASFINNANGAFTVIGVIPTGACCTEATGVCQNGVTQSACDSVGQRYGGDGSTCATINPPCVAPTGACCDDTTGTCTEPVTQSSCEGSGRRYGGNNVLCADINPPCVPPPTGACCDDSTGTCDEAVTGDACKDSGRRYGGNNVLCADINPACVPPPPPPLQIGLELIAGAGPTAANLTLASPLGITDAGDGTGRLFIHDQTGLIRVIDAGGTLLKDPMLDVSALMPPLGIDFGGGFPIFDERGLLGLTFHPDFENSASPGYGKFYIRYSKPRTSTGTEPCDLDIPPGVCHEEVLAEYTMMGDPLTNNVADAGSEVILFRWDKPQWNHNAGHIEFGPDGYLYISTGDGGGAHDGLCDSPKSHGPGGNGQNIESKLGKMIRINVDGTDGPGGLYGIPADNPFVGVAGLDEIYAYGFRNPFRFSFDLGLITDSLYVADVGQDIYEEVDDVVIGGNYGWAIREGAHCFEPPCTPLPGCGDPGLIDPISEYTHAEGGTAVIGGYVYRGAAYPQLVGKYVYGDDASDFFSPSGRLYYFDLTGPEAFVRKEFFIAPSGAPFGKFLKGFGRDADGEIYVAASDVLGPSGTTGVIYKIVPPPPGDIVWNADPLSADRTTRSLRFRLPTPVTATGAPPQLAIKVTMIDLQNPIPANLPQYPPPDFSTYESATCTAAGEANGCARWVGKPGTFLESQDNPGGAANRAARLQCTPFYYDWITETAGGPIAVVGAEIAPSSEYSVQTYGASCKGAETGCANVSTVVTMYTRRSGEVEQPFNPPATSTQPDVTDIAQLVNKFKNVAGAPVKAIAQLQPNLPELNADINALDIVAVVDAVKQFAYAFGGPCACPSAVPCGPAVGSVACTSPSVCVTAFGAGSLCVRTCTGGTNADDPCINNTHCPGVGATCGNGFCRDRCGRCTP